MRQERLSNPKRRHARGGGPLPVYWDPHLDHLTREELLPIITNEEVALPGWGMGMKMEKGFDIWGGDTDGHGTDTRG